MLKDATLLDKGLKVIYVFTVDIEGQDKPALVAEQIVRFYP
jgi:acyl dehydratase